MEYYDVVVVQTGTLRSILLQWGQGIYDVSTVCVQGVCVVKKCQNIAQKNNTQPTLKAEITINIPLTNQIIGINIFLFVQSL